MLKMTFAKAVVAFILDLDEQATCGACAERSSSLELMLLLLPSLR